MLLSRIAEDISAKQGIVFFWPTVAVRWQQVMAIFPIYVARDNETVAIFIPNLWNVSYGLVLRILSAYGCRMQLMN